MITLGIERLHEYRHLFAGKRVGLITNPTGVTSDFTATIDLLGKATDLVALFGPEHGVRGDIQAGVRFDDYIDDASGVPVYSLYGATKEPTAEMMANIDIMAFDIQDVGLRFYTYLYTLANALKACGEHHVPMVVFDRPNPLGGEMVEGVIIDDDCTSFVGNYGLVQRYGLTIGEFARYVNDTAGFDAELHVVPMAGYRREMDFAQTALPWVLPSPNIPTMESPLYYAATCLFEGTNVSEGRGTTKPFQIIGCPKLDVDHLLVALKQDNLPGVMFRKLHFTPTFSKHAGTLCHGVELYVTDRHAFRPVRTGLTLLKRIEQIHPAFSFLPPYKQGHHPMIDLLTGNEDVRKGVDLATIIRALEEDSKRFLERKRRYHLYD